MTNPKRNEQQRRAIIERHLENMLRELRELGDDPLGVAGGIVFGENPPRPNAGSPCHVFHVINSDVRPTNRPGLDEETFVSMFLADVGLSLARAAQAGKASH